MLLQLEHMIDHEEIYHSDTNDLTQHFHKDNTYHCAFLHQELNFHYTYPIAFYQAPKHLESFANILYLHAQISNQVLPYAALRAPPV